MWCHAERKHPYAGYWAAIATMHGKERAIAPPLCQWFGMTVTGVPGVDTDALGTFTGETARAGTMLDAARAKALLAIERTGAPLGIGSEGAFGPDPHIPFLASGHEILVLREKASDHEISVNRRALTNYDHLTVAPCDCIDTFLQRIGFPSHAVIVRPADANAKNPIFKGLIKKSDVERAIDIVARKTPGDKVMLQTDMRAHLNPTRMTTIGRIAKRLAWRIARLCPNCEAPGFGLTGVERGLRCSDCGLPTHLVRAEIHSCKACGHTMRKFERSDRVHAEARWCEFCNP